MIMKIVKTALLFSVISVVNAENNVHYGFSALDNKDAIFVEKCKIWRELAENNDIEGLSNFLDPALIKQHPKKILPYIANKVKYLKADLAKEDYRVVSIELEPSSESLAYVAVKYKYEKDKGSGKTSCRFEKFDGGWRKIP